MIKYQLSKNVNITGFEDYTDEVIPQQYLNGHYILKNKIKDRDYIINESIKYYIEKFNLPKTEIEVLQTVEAELQNKSPEIANTCSSFFKVLCDKRILIQEDEEEHIISVDTIYKEGDDIDNLRITKILSESRHLDIYLATDSATGIEYVIKLLSRNKTLNENIFNSELADLEKEFVIMMSVNHIPFTCHAYDFKRDVYQNPYIVIEYFKSQSLSSFLRTSISLSPDEILQLVDDILSVFNVFHKNKIVHGDIHLSNILIGDDKTIKLIDFGLSHSIALEKNEVLIFGGVNFYMPPERINISSLNKYKTAPDLHSDVYQIGLVIYKILYNTLPFDGFIWEELAKNIKEGVVNYPAVSFTGFRINNELIKLIKKCINKNPEERYVDASDILKDYREYVFHSKEKLVN